MSNFSRKDLHCSSDRTKQQQKYMSHLRQELLNRESNGENDFIIKYIKGTPKIINSKNKVPIPSIQLLLSNVRGLNTKFNIFKTNIDFFNFKILAFTEIWLHNYVNSLIFGLFNYEMYRCYRSFFSSSSTRRGGVLMSINKKCFLTD